MPCRPAQDTSRIHSVYQSTRRVAPLSQFQEGGEGTADPPLRSPGFPVDFNGFRELPEKKQVLIKPPLVLGTAGSTNEKAGAPSFALLAKGGIRDGRYRGSRYPTLRKKREGWGTRRVT
jgi:hypothetical protein